MKYIKLYEANFEKIPSNELDSTNAIEFSKDDLELVSKAIYPSKISVDPKTYLIKLGWTFPGMIGGDRSYFGYTYQKSDEWFYVFFAGDPGKIISYKCDQIEGLIDCLKEFRFMKGDFRSGHHFRREA